MIAGEVNDTSGPVTAGATDPVYLDIELQPGAEYTAALPTRHNAFAYVYAGAADVGAPPQRTEARELSVLGRGGDAVRLVGAGTAPAGLLLVAGRPLGEPIARHGPFVMNTDQQIRQAVEDLRAGRL